MQLVKQNDENKRIDNQLQRIQCFLKLSSLSAVILAITNSFAILMFSLGTSITASIVIASVLWLVNILLTFLIISIYLDECFKGTNNFNWRLATRSCSILAIYYWPVFAVRYMIPTFWREFEKPAEENILMQRTLAIKKELESLASTQISRTALQQCNNTIEELHKIEELKAEDTANIIASNRYKELLQITDLGFGNLEAHNELMAMYHTKELTDGL